ncbi:MAG: T9SS type A sorting domain-containing protein, partial [bacterium]|nr:T9SS type A sorting domain-containing protein [bacterium]
GSGFHEVMPNPETVYFSNITPQDIITRPVTVYVPFDMRSAYGKLNTPGEYIIDVQSGDTVRQFNTVNLAGFYNNWPWGSFPTSDNANDNGATGDLVANDSVWTANHLFPIGSPRTFVFKGGINGYDVEAGFGENHEVAINDATNTFRMPEVCFGSQGTLYANWQTRCRNSSVWMSDPDMPNSFAILQNYPNPFNPTTTIEFSIPNQAEVKFEVFDLTGRTVMTENHGLMNAGTYTLSFDGSALSSGTYFYKISAGSNFAVRQMLLMK